MGTHICGICNSEPCRCRKAQKVTQMIRAAQRPMNLYREAIENTAERLGVDPLALAEACRDGDLLADVFLLSTDPKTRNAYLALKRASEPKP